MTVRVATDSRNAALAAVNVKANAGSGAATLKVYTGAQPANANTAESGTLLATFTMADPCFETESTGVMDFDANPDISATAVATGTPGWARLADSAGNAVLDGTVGTSGTDFIIDTATLVSGQTINFLSGSVTFPV